MRFPAPLIRGTLIRRYKRFLADVRLDSGRTVTAHCANPGSMLSVDAAGSEVWLSAADNPARKLAYTWELIRVGTALVGINTAQANRLVAEAIGAGRMPELAGYSSLRREVRYGQRSRIDLLLEAPGRPKCYVEVKSVTMKRNPAADAPVEFPDAVTERGRRHLAELTAVTEGGERAVMMFLAQREDAPRLAIAADIDPRYADALAKAQAAGVEVLFYRCRVSTQGIEVADGAGV